MNLSDDQTFRVTTCDLNGQMRGKRVPGNYAGKLDKGAVRMPLSIMNVDIFGADIENSPLVFATGDADGVLFPTGRGPLPMPWLKGAPALVPMTMHHEDGRPFETDPRHALAGVLARYEKRSWQVIASTELEFTLLDDSGSAPAPLRDPVTGRRFEGAQILSLDHIDRFDAFFTALYDGCAAMGIPAQTTTSEAGIGQFEITLNHQDAMRAADDTWLFKALIRGTARQYGMAATFMAKPFAEDAGNGMHMHFSVLDRAGLNIFDNGGAEGTDLLRQAIAGCLEAMSPSTLIFAPHANSYARMVPGAHAPTSVCWAYENRTAAIRVPGGAPAARRIEHRVAGGDTNPYLVFAAVLGAAMDGIEQGVFPPAPLTGNAYDQPFPQLAADWASAIAAFRDSPVMQRILPEDLIGNMVRTKEQEQHLMGEIPEDRHWKTYLDTV